VFTGIVRELGRVVSFDGARLLVEAPQTSADVGDSIAVDGVCLTVVEHDGDGLAFDVVGETLSRSTLGTLAADDRVNVEPALRAGEPLGGHIVQGHVDGAGVMTALDPVIPATSPDFNRETTDWTLKVRIPESLRQWMVPKGSVAIEGISLTIAAIEDNTISIAILPLTYWRTNLHTLSLGAPVNVEADVLVKLAYQQMQSAKKSEFDLTEPWLVANGY
jgi:riboflavin synthase